jgi:acid phosphatase
VRAGLVAAALLLLGACTSPATGPSSAPPSSASSSSVPVTPGAVPAPAHVLVVVFENEDAQDVLGPGGAPYLTALAATGASFTDAHGETHPSQPNYLALFSGSTQGVTDDSCPRSFSGPNLGRQLLDAGRTFAGYSEDQPSAGYTGCRSGGYARKHNPWVDFSNLPASVDLPFSDFPADYARLPTVSFVVPDLCHDMHDCPVPTGDAWAREHLAPYLSWARTHDSLLIVTFDEDSGSAANRIATFAVGPMVRAGASGQRVDHYTLLRTMEEMYGLAPLGAAADRSPIRDVWIG